MSESITREELAFPSAEGTITAQAYVWRDEALESYAGIVQIVHGMAEHITRYDDFARMLAAQGYIVVGNDHIGHGASVNGPQDWGHLPPHTGKDILLSDCHQLRSIAVKRFGAYPYFLFGHSLGSFVTLCYLPRYGSTLSGAIICGTGYVAPGTSKMGNTLARLICRVRGERSYSTLLHNMGVGAYSKAIENPRTDCDWLSFNEANVDAYIADEQSGFMFTAGGYAVVTALTAEACSPTCAEAFPKDVPLFYIAGDSDPVGSSGVGVKKAFEMAQQAGVRDASCTIYENMRHEILNERGHERVYADVLAWLDVHKG